MAKTYPVAMRTFGIWDGASKERFDVAVWYPGGSSGAQTQMEGWSIPAGHGKIIPGFYPVILLSHDTAASRFANNDLAVALAGSGFLVVAPTHMDDNQAHSDKILTAEIMAQRPRQLLRALETVLSVPELSPHVDESRIGLLGVGFGGITVMQLAGLRPDPGLLKNFCAKKQVQDLFCSSWSGKRLAHLDKDMAMLEGPDGRSVFTPPLIMYAPELEPAPPLPPVQEAAAPQRRPEEKKLSLWQSVFGTKAEAEDPAPDSPAEEKNAPRQSGSGSKGSSYVLAIDFQGGAWFGGTDSGGQFVHIDPPGKASSLLRLTVKESVPATPSEALPHPTRTPPRARRKPASMRQIRAMAMLAPAGGMFFSQKNLATIRVPLAVVEAGKDELYPPANHAADFITGISPQPEVLRLPEADHYSVFAPCSQEISAVLAASCGRLRGEDRLKAAQERDAFLTTFFLSAMGGALPPEPPSEFVAVEKKQELSRTAPPEQGKHAPARTPADSRTGRR